MLYLIMLFWIGKALAAPTWFWVIWALAAGWKETAARRNSPAVG